MSWSSRDRRWPPVPHGTGRLLLVGVAPAALVMAQAAAGQTVPRLEVDVSVLASENPLLLTGTDRGAVLVDISARPGVRFTSPMGSFVDLGGVVTHRRYSHRYGDFVVGRADAEASYRRNEYLTVAANVAVSRDLAVDLLTSSVEAGVDPSSIRTAALGRLAVTWHPDANSWVLPELSIDRFGYDRSSLLGDTRSINASLAFRRRTSARTTVGLRAGTIFSETERAANSDTQVLYATLDRRLNAGWRVAGELGAERVGARNEIVLGTGVAQGARTRIGGRAELCREAPGPVICVTAGLNSEVSGLGGLQRRAVATASLDQRLGERTTLSLDADYQRTVMQGGVFPTFDAVRGVAALERTLRRDVRLGATVQYLRRRTIDGTRVGAAFAGLRLVYAPVLR